MSARWMDRRGSLQMNINRDVFEGLCHKVRHNSSALLKQHYEDGRWCRSECLTCPTPRLDRHSSTRTCSPFSTADRRGELLTPCNLDESSERFVDGASVRKCLRHVRLEQDQGCPTGRLRVIL